MHNFSKELVFSESELSIPSTHEFCWVSHSGVLNNLEKKLGAGQSVKTIMVAHKKIELLSATQDITAVAYLLPISILELHFPNF